MNPETETAGAKAPASPDEEIDMEKMIKEIERRRDLWADCLAQGRAIGNETFNNRMCAKLVELNELLSFAHRMQSEAAIAALMGKADVDA